MNIPKRAMKIDSCPAKLSVEGLLAVLHCDSCTPLCLVNGSFPTHKTQGSARCAFEADPPVVPGKDLDISEIVIRVHKRVFGEENACGGLLRLCSQLDIPRRYR